MSTQDKSQWLCETFPSLRRDINYLFWRSHEAYCDEVDRLYAEYCLKHKFETQTKAKDSKFSLISLCIKLWHIFTRKVK